MAASCCHGVYEPILDNVAGVDGAPVLNKIEGLGLKKNTIALIVERKISSMISTQVPANGNGRRPSTPEITCVHPPVQSFGALATPARDRIMWFESVK